MKLTIFALLAGLSVLAVSVNGGVVVPPTGVVDDVNAMPGDSSAPSNGAIESMISHLKKTLNDLEDVECGLASAPYINEAAQSFLNDVETCGLQSEQELQDIIKSSKDVLSTGKDLIVLKTQSCDVGSETNGTKKRTSLACDLKLSSKLLTLKKQVSDAVSSIQEVKLIPGEAKTCIGNSVETLKNVFSGFPDYIQSCAQSMNN